MSNPRTVSYTVRRNGHTMERGRFSSAASNTLSLYASRGMMDLAVRCGEGAVIMLRSMCQLEDGRIIGHRQPVTVCGSDGWTTINPGTPQARKEYVRVMGYQVCPASYRGFPAKKWPQE